MQQDQGATSQPFDDQDRQILDLSLAMLRQELYSSIYNLTAYLELMHAEDSMLSRDQVNAIRQQAVDLRTQLHDALDQNQLSILISDDKELSPRRKLNHLISQLQELIAQHGVHSNSNWHRDLKQALDSAHHLFRWLDQLYHGVKRPGQSVSMQSRETRPVSGQSHFTSPGLVNFNQVLERRADHYAGLNMTGRILVVDDDDISRAILVQSLVSRGFMTAEASNGSEAFTMLRHDRYDLVLLDTTMPGVNGIQVIRWMHEHPELSVIPVLMMSSMHQIDLVAQCLLLGADDFMIKPINDVLLISRIVGCLDKYAAFLEMKRSREKVIGQLAQAGRYIRTVLPKPISQGPIKIDWRFEPSQMLGGDIFGYHWLKKKQLAIYLLDVSGHGVEAAMLAETAIHFLRAKLLNKTNYDQPRKVLRGMNQIFDSEKHGGNYFTLWYGVIDLENQLLRYASAGHPPALLLKRKGQKTKIDDLITIQPPIGLVPDFKYTDAERKLPEYFELLLFSDGLYELESEYGGFQSLDSFLSRIRHEVTEFKPQALIQDARAYQKGKSFDDDVTVIKVSGVYDELFSDSGDYDESGIF